ncbi:MULTISPECIES: AraC family transcriptional regulator [Paenibacillus]|jgi:AraC family transcriptional regulator, transcriptional activator for feuABC-ybbA operon|uniref:AraC family transcriptional regulator n=1 Tax=Paenibacillus TaxID=44249 RepID=UPI00096EA859|nr:AraC family transcriptional regulator [Paenibacillus sp. FSL H8-0259]OMF28936.1 hypothetical protein BK132_13300 [Paenibacillus sp. FSL H8-0259]
MPGQESTDKPHGQPRIHPHHVQDSRNKINRTVVHMEEHFEEAISREQLAVIAGLNPEHYSRMFSKYKGVSPISYLTGLRMEKAMELIKHSQYSIAEIARRVGYSDPYHFSRRFKQLYGAAPTHFKKQAWPRVIALEGLGHCQALGVDPVAVNLEHTNGYLRVPESSQILNISPDITPKLDINQLLALSPYAIVTSNPLLEQQLVKVAPVIKIDVLEDPIYKQLFAVAEGLDRELEALAWVESYETQCTVLRSRLFGFMGGERVAILRVREQLLQVYGMLNMGYPLYHSLQLTPPEKISMQCICNVHFHSSVITIEELPFFEAEHLFVVVQPDDGANKQWQGITQTEAWRNFPAVRRGNIHHLDVGKWLSNDPVSITMQMHEAAEKLMRRHRHHNYPSRMQ